MQAASGKWQEWRFVLIGLVVAAVAAFVYGPGLGLPFYSDDMYHFRWVETHDAAELLLPSSSFASYRPLPSLIWYLWRHTVGFYSPAGFYALNLLLHIANSWLVVALTRRLNAGTSTWLPWAAGLVFVLYPFSYQAVLWVGALTHLLGAFLILLALLFYSRGRRGDWGWMAASWLAGLLAPFANEAGLTVVGLVLLYEWAAPRAATKAQTATKAKMITRIAPTLTGPVLYLAVWLGWGARGPAGLLERMGQVEQLLQKATYFAQGVTFPLQFAAARFADQWSWSVGQAVGWGVAISLAALALCYARLGWWRRFGLGWGWAALTMLPPLVALSAAYVDTAPRLLYIPSVGVACLWGWAVAGLPSTQRLGLALRTGTLALILLPSLAFLRQRIALFELVARPAQQAVEVSQASPDDSLLFVNLPAWAAYKENAFPVSVEGVAFLPGYVGMVDFVWANTGLDVDVQAATFANIQQDQPYWYGSWGEAQDWETLGRAIRDVDRVYVALYGEEEIRLVEAGGVGDSATARPLARFDGGISLLDAQATPESDGLTVVLIWSTEEHPEVGDAVFAQLFDEQGRLVSQADGLALANTFPFWLCQAGDVVRDVRWLPAPGGLAPGEYRLLVGMYNIGSGARRPVWGDGGTRFADDVAPALSFGVDR